MYENVLFFPVAQMLKDRYPGVLFDVVASAKGKQVYEMCMNVTYANVYDPDDDWPEPTEYTHMLGVLKVRTYVRVYIYIYLRYSLLNCIWNDSSVL